MIESISIADVGSYGNTPEVLDGLSQINFLFGSNGTGKTTVSRVITDESKHPTCKVSWKGGTKLQSMAYNYDFIDKNFNQSTELKGVFTLGEKQVGALEKIITSKAELDALTRKIESLTLGVQGIDGTGGKRGELIALEARLKDTCWAQKHKHDATLQGAFEGYRGNSEKFKTKVLQERVSNSATVVTLAELEKRAQVVFGPTPAAEQAVPSIESAKVVAHESNPVLKKRVIGKENVDIAAMIKKLGSSDWVRAGRTFYEANESVCPFCQQSTTDEFSKSLNEYFDVTFESDSKAVEELATNYNTDSARLQQQVAIIIAAEYRFLDHGRLKAEKELLDSKITINVQKILEKKKEPSQVVELESIRNVVDAINALVDAANSQVVEHNRIAANLVQERATLTKQVWKYLVEHELKTDLAAYSTSRSDMEKAISAMTAQMATAKSEKSTKVSEIRELEKQTTSVQPTIDGINALLSSFGFRGFSLAKAASGTSYKLVRPDGSDAKATLSEGEKTFVTFLYFYHLLKGSDSDSGMSVDRIVVFDDPVSSLDSDILFIVGSLIKGLFEEVRGGTGHIKQVFVLTHNVYFHREVTFNSKRRKDMAMNEETFWVVRKPELTSKLHRHSSNPIKTSYELLWTEVRKSDRSTLTIQNTLRRILENYFKILGGIDPDKICSKFEGKEKMICRSLFSWVNDGSHYANDDLYISIDESMAQIYLKVFRTIFEKLDQLAHYRMMMGDAFAEDAA